MSPDTFFSVPLSQIVPDTTLAFKIYLFINNHFVLFRNEECELEDDTYTRLQLKKVKFIFIEEKQREQYDKYKARLEKINQEMREALESPLGQIQEEAVTNMEKALETDNIEAHIDKITDLASETAKNLTDELMQKPYSNKLLSQLTVHSHGIYGHSVNVGTLAIHLAMKLGYNQGHILEYIGTAGLLHDIGKTKINIALLNKNQGYTPHELNLLKQHPSIGRGLLLSVTGAPEEVRLMVYQHHEHHDGSGYPDGIRGSRIYELTKILSVVNTFEHIFQGLKKKGNFQIDKVITLLNSKQLSGHFDPKILDRASKILNDFQ